ncbi:MAG: hypothetical protein WAN20_05860 [Pseudonocardiaceae bacterium]
MKCLLTLAATALLCIIGAGLAPAVIAPTAYGSMVTRLSTPTPTTRAPTITTPVASDDTAPAAPVAAVTPPADQATTAATTAKQADHAMHAVLPKVQDGFEVFDLQTGTVLTSNNAGQQFAAMSVVKLLIALDALARDNWVIPDGATQQQIRQMLADSDDEIADGLWTAGGGPAIVTRMAGRLGLTGTQPPDDPGEWGDTLITPRDMVTVYRYIAEQVPGPDRDLLLGALSGAPRIAADGFNQYFGIPDGMPHTTWAIKQGWGTSGSQAVMDSTGLVGPDLRYVVVVLASAPANSYSTVPAAVTAGAGELAGLVGSAGS